MTIIFATIAAVAPPSSVFALCGLHLPTGCSVYFGFEWFSLNIIGPGQFKAVPCPILWNRYLERFAAILSLRKLINFDNVFIDPAACRDEILYILSIMFFINISNEYVKIWCSLYCWCSL